MLIHLNPLILSNLAFFASINNLFILFRKYYITTIKQEYGVKTCAAMVSEPQQVLCSFNRSRGNLL